MSNHFGMGLYISEKLCEKHGGNLTLVNGMDQGAIVAARFRVNSKIDLFLICREFVGNLYVFFF